MNFSVTKQKTDGRHQWSIKLKANGRKIGTLYSDGDSPKIDIRTRFMLLEIDHLIELKSICEKEFATIKRYGLS